MKKMGNPIRNSIYYFIAIAILLGGLFTGGAWAQVTIVSQTPTDKSFNNPVNTPIRIQFNQSMNTSSTWIELGEDDEIEIAGTVQWSQTTLPNDTLTFTPNNALKPAAHYGVGCSAMALSGWQNFFDFAFITKPSTADSTPPTVQTVYPHSGATGVSTTTMPSIKFSEAMNPNTINSANITISGLSSTDYSVTYDFWDGGVDITKNTPFSPLSAYTVTITTNVKDLRGNWLRDQYQWSFTTGSADTTPPTVLQTIPAIGAEKVSTNPVFHVIFSEEMDESSLTPSNITLYNVTTSSGVPINIYWSWKDNVVFGSQSTLTNGNQYRVTLGTGVKDLAGNGLSTPYIWTFTVAGPVVDSFPVIQFGTSPYSHTGIRWSDGTTNLELELGAWDDNTDPLTVTATAPGKNWTLTKPPGEDAYSYESSGDEGLSAGTHTLTFTVKDGASPQNTVTFQRTIFIFDASPVLSSPSNGATGVSTTPNFQWTYGGVSRPVYYGVYVLDGPNPDTAKIIWKGYRDDTGSGTQSVTIPPEKKLAPNTTYYLAVVGSNYEENGDTISEIRPFTTGGTPPPLPSFSGLRVRSDDRVTGMQWNIGAKIVGPSPADIRELKVTGPGGFRYIFTEDDILQSEFNGIYFWRNLTNALANGTYTFTVTDLMGRISTSNLDFTSVSLPRVDSSTMSPSNNAYIGTTTPTFSWGSVGSGYSYRISIFDWNVQEADIYSSSYIQETQFTLPSGYLLPNTPYEWRVEVFDNSRNNRSVSNNSLNFSTGSYPYTLNLDFGIVWGENNFYGGNRKTIQPIILGPLPDHVSQLTVAGPGFAHTFQQSEIRWGAGITGTIYSYGEPGFPPDGTYNFNLQDTFGGSDDLSKEQTSIAIPIVDQSSMFPANNAYLNTLTPTFTWSGVEGSPRYYRISIFDWRERYIVYQSLRSTDLFAAVPAGALQVGRSYKWRVEVFDGPDALVADNRSSSGWNCFTTSIELNPLNDTTEFVKQQYRDFLNREAETGGLQYWVNIIDSGAMTRAQVIESFFWSQEFGATIAPVVRLYFAYFLRIPDYGGLMYWIDQFSNGQSLGAISDAFAASPEFQQTYGSLNNEQFVTLIYQNVLGRAPDSGGYAFWVGELNSGRRTRGQVMIGFSESDEYEGLTSHEVYVTMMYIGMLRRAPEEDGFNFWVDYLDSGNSGLALIDGFLYSQEYADRFQ